jgi:hypothetical protein
MAYRIYMPLPDPLPAFLKPGFKTENNILPPDLKCAILEYKASLNSGIEEDEGVYSTADFIGQFKLQQKRFFGRFFSKNESKVLIVLLYRV